MQPKTHTVEDSNQKELKRTENRIITDSGERTNLCKTTDPPVVVIGNKWQSWATNEEAVTERERIKMPPNFFYKLCTKIKFDTLLFMRNKYDDA